MNEIKIILILNNMSYSADKREELQQMAIKSAVNRNIKEIEINKNNFLFIFFKKKKLFKKNK